jgi:hypothetical protein
MFSAILIGAGPHIAGAECGICIPVKEQGQPGTASHANGKSAYLKGRNRALLLSKRASSLAKKAALRTSAWHSKARDGRRLLSAKRKPAGEFPLLFMAYSFKRVINILGINKLMQAIGQCSVRIVNITNARKS